MVKKVKHRKLKGSQGRPAKRRMVIRRAKKADAVRICSLLAQLGYPDFDSKITAERIRVHRQPGYAMLVAEMNGVVVAFISLHWFELAHWKEKFGRITSFCVDESCRSQGIGTLLLKAGEAILTRKKCNKIEVTSNNRRTRAHQFYLGAKYQEDSRRFTKLTG